MSLTYERLEERVLLAVTFSMNPGAGLLVINGDAADDVIDINGSGVNTFEVNGVPFGGFQEIRINSGGGDDTITINGVLLGKNLIINSGDGDDTVDISDINVKRLDVVTGNGDDTVLLGGTSNMIHTTGLFNLGAGDNSLDMANVRFNSGVNVQSLVGDDTVTMDNVSVGANLNLNLGGGTNSLDMSNQFGENVTYAGGAGSDTVNVSDSTLRQDLNIRTNAGDDSVSLNNVNVEDLRVDTAAGLDTVDVVLSRVRLSTTINTGDGDDSVTLDRSVFVDDPVNIDTGAGDDTITTTRNAFRDKLTIKAGAGDDVINMVPDNRMYLGDVRVDGGAGIDELITAPIQSPIRAYSKGIEIFTIA